MLIVRLTCLAGMLPVPQVLALPDVQHGVTIALADDSILVREAALELIGK